MSLFKFGSQTKILRKASSIEGLLLDKPVEAAMPKTSIISPVLEDHLFYRARAISAGDQGPMDKNGDRGFFYNGNFDFFPKDELIKACPSFPQKNIFLDHNSESSLYSIGKILDSYPVEDPETGEFYLEILGRIDKTLHPEICRKIQTGELNSTSMGCSVDESICSICAHVLHSDADEKCQHLSHGLGKQFEAEVDFPEYNIKKGEMIPCFSINKGIQFSEDSIVGVPADPTAVIKAVVANMRYRLNKKASLTSEEQTDFVKQFENLLSKVDSDMAIKLKAEFCGICPPAPIKESSMSETNLSPNEETKKILNKISAYEMEQLESYVAHKTKKANEIVNKEVVADATKKEETFLSKIVAKVKDSFAAQLLEKKIETVAKEEIEKESGSAPKPCKEHGSFHSKYDCEQSTKEKKEDKESSLSAKFNEDTKNVLASTWSVYEGDKLVLDASLKDIWGSQFETLSFADQKWATSEAYGKEAIARYQKEGLAKLADLWDVSGKISKVAGKCERCEDLLSEKDPSREYDPDCAGSLCAKHEEEYLDKKKASLKTAAEPKLGPSGTHAKPSTGTSNKTHNYPTDLKFTKPGQEQAQKGPAAPAAKEVKTETKIDMPGQEKGQTGPAAPKAKEVKTDYSEPKPEAEGKEVKTTPKNPEEKKLEKSEKEVETSYVAKGTEAMEAEEKGEKKEDKKASLSISWSSLTPKAQNFIKTAAKSYIASGMKNAEAVAKAHSEFTAQETDMKKQATEAPVESVEESTIPDGKKEIGDKPEESVQGTTLPEEGKAATPETSVDGDKAVKTPNLTVAPVESVEETTIPSGSKVEESVEETTHPDSTKSVGTEPDKAVKTAATEMPMPEDKDVMAPAIDDVKVDEVPAEHETENLALPVDAPVEAVSAFDTAETVDIGEGYSAAKDKESKEIIVSKDGKEVKRLPDGFGKEMSAVLPLMKAVLGLPPEEAKPEVPGIVPPMEEKPEIPAVEEHPALEDAHEDELGIKESALKIKEAELIAKEASIKAQEEALKKEAAAKHFAEVLKARSERCKKIIAAMVEKGAIEMDKTTYDSERQIGTYLLDAQYKAFEAAISNKNRELIAMNDESLLAMEKVVADLKAPVVRKASHIFASPAFGIELSEDEEIAKIFKTMGTGKHPQ
jgi:hypothetical protein